MNIRITEIAPDQTLDLRHRVMWPDKPRSYVELEEDQNGIHFGAWKNDRLVTVVSLFMVDGQAQFRKLATEREEQGKGYASQVLNHLMNYATHKGVKLIWCNARRDKTSFYERFGMVKTKKCFSKGGIDYVIMEKVI